MLAKRSEGKSGNPQISDIPSGERQSVYVRNKLREAAPSEYRKSLIFGTFLRFARKANATICY